MIDLLNIPASDAERIAYAEGFTMAAELFARIDALEHAASTLLNYMDMYAPKDLGDEIDGAIDQLREVLQ
jgi:hypothetical protein